MSLKTEELVAIRDSVTLQDIKPPLIPHEYFLAFGVCALGTIVTSKVPGFAIPMYASEYVQYSHYFFCMSRSTALFKCNVKILKRS